MRPETLGVIGLGAIGGSVAWQAARAGTARVLGYTPQPKEGVMAVRCGAITELAPNIPYVLRNADLVVLAAPPGATLRLLQVVADEGRKTTPLVTDVTSVKQPVAAAARAAGLEMRFAGSHPLAGTHARGFAAATADRFRSALVYVTPVGEDQRPVREVADFWAGVLEAEPVIVSPDEHDRVLAWTSHLPQAVASALSFALATGGPRGVTYGPGARDTTRIAASSAEMWTDVFMLNREPILSALDRFDQGLVGLRRALSNGDATALREWLERGGFLETTVRRMKVSGVIRPPGDKSVTHRALMLAALADGESELTGGLTATDVRRTATMLRQLGADLGPLREGARLRVRGRPWLAPKQTLHCGNSGTGARLLLGLLAGHCFAARLTGDASLRSRPMRRVTEPLSQMGATFRESGGGTLPITIQGGHLSGLEYRSPVASAQVKSALLFAGLVARTAVTVIEPWRSRDHSERLLAHLGFDIKVRDTRVTLDAQRAAPDMPRPFHLNIPGDPSSAAFLAASALMAEGGELTIENVGVNPTRVGFLKVIERMGAGIAQRDRRNFGNEPVADLVVRPADLSGTEVTAAEIPSLVDEVPILAVLASRAKGETVFREVGELRVKESNRLELIATNLRSVGGRAEVQGDSLVVDGSPGPPRGRVDTAGDHRLTMAFAVLGTLPGAQVTLSERASAAVSYPGFFRDVARISTNAG